MHMYKQSTGTFNAGFYLILLIIFFIDILLYEFFNVDGVVSRGTQNIHTVPAGVPVMNMLMAEGSWDV